VLKVSTPNCWRCVSRILCDDWLVVRSLVTLPDRSTGQLLWVLTGLKVTLCSVRSWYSKTRGVCHDCSHIGGTDSVKYVPAILVRMCPLWRLRNQERPIDVWKFWFSYIACEWSTEKALLHAYTQHTVEYDLTCIRQPTETTLVKHETLNNKSKRDKNQDNTGKHEHWTK